LFSSSRWQRLKGPRPKRRLFFQGKQLTLLINFTAGGPTDTEGRLLARHLAKYIPGNPTIIVRNMGGAGGAIGANYLGQVAAPDGLTLGYFTGLATAASVAIPSIKVDVAKFEFVSGGPGISVAYARSDLGGGIRKPEDLLQKKDFWVGGLALDSDKDIRIRLQLDLLGLPYKYITGYPGSADIRLALMRNEVQLNVESMPAYRASVEPDLIKSGQAIPLWYDINDEANAQKSQDTAGIDALPFGLFYKKVKGEDPRGIKWDAYDRLNQIGTNFERLIVMPQGSPAAAVSALKSALLAVDQDKDFQQDALTTIKFVPKYETDAEKERLFHEKLDPDPRIKAFVDQYIEEGKTLNGAR
jgi:tripartite-type tricarboxylate transporter receptor subunit TctC